MVPAGAFSDFLRPGRRYSLATAGRGAACPTDGVAAADRPPAGAADPCGGLIVCGGSAVALRLGKKRLHGAFATYKDYVIAAVREGGGEAVVEGRPAFPVALVTEEEGATVRLLFEHQTPCKVWKAAIEGMLVEQKLNRGSN